MYISLFVEKSIMDFKKALTIKTVLSLYACKFNEFKEICQSFIPFHYRQKCKYDSTIYDINEP